MNEAVTGSDDRSPGILRAGDTNFIGNVGRGLADQLQIAQGGVVDQPAGHETGLIEPIGVGEHLPGEEKPIVEIEAPCALTGVRR